MARTRLTMVLAALLAGCASEPGGPSFDRTSDDELAQGKRLATVLGCAGCHGPDLTGKDWSSEGFVTMRTGNLTQAAARYSKQELEAVIRTGRRPGGRELWDMPSHLFTRLAKADMDPLLAYLRSQPPKGAIPADPVFEAQARKEMASGLYKSSAREAIELGEVQAPAAGTGHDLARYIVRTTCAECHGVDLRGGIPFPGAPFRPDLRVVSAYDKADFMRLLTTGKAAGNRELPMMSTAARNRYAHLTDAERAAIYAYLKALGDEAAR